MKCDVDAKGPGPSSANQTHGRRLQARLYAYRVSQKNPPLRFSENFSQTVGNF